MEWEVILHPGFLVEFAAFPEGVQDNILAKSLLLSKLGPHCGRPHVDSLQGSSHSNMKELRLDVDGGVWRVAFAFDPRRKAVLLVAGNKIGKNQRRFYHDLIRKADSRFRQHLAEKH